MRKGPFGKTKHPWGYWWLTLIVGQVIAVGITIALNPLYNGGQSFITFVFDGIMLLLMPFRIKSKDGNGDEIVKNEEIKK